jgi:hypothetical protein
MRGSSVTKYSRQWIMHEDQESCPLGMRAESRSAVVKLQSQSALDKHLTQLIGLGFWVNPK